jgi:dTDP-4-amino-4,6-dideoxygalactose transaminase
MTEFQGALLRIQLERLPQQIRQREESAGALTDALKGIGELQLPPTDARITSNAWTVYAFRIPQHGLSGGKKRFAAALAAEGIPCAEGYGSLHHNRALLAAAAALSPQREYKPNDCPVSDEVAETAIWLPQYVLLGEQQDIDDVAAAIEKVMNGLKE